MRFVESTDPLDILIMRTIAKYHRLAKQEENEDLATLIINALSKATSKKAG